MSSASTASRTQIPLRHAWALTLHKSQGFTLQPVQDDMANTRTPGQAYVALSRVPSLDQLTIVYFSPMAVKRFYKTLKRDECDDASDRDTRNVSALHARRRNS